MLLLLLLLLTQVNFFLVSGFRLEYSFPVPLPIGAGRSTGFKGQFTLMLDLDCFPIYDKVVSASGTWEWGCWRCLAIWNDEVTMEPAAKMKLSKRGTAQSERYQVLLKFKHLTQARF